MTTLSPPLIEIGRISHWHEVASFWCDGEPKGQPRPRAFARKMGNKFVARVYDAGTAEGWKSCVADSARRLLPQSPWTQPIKLRIEFTMPRPKSHFRTGKHRHDLRPDAPRMHVGKPDADNLAKAVMDALTRLGMWKDDGQVCACEILKRFGNQPGAAISVEVFE